MYNEDLLRKGINSERGIVVNEREVSPTKISEIKIFPIRNEYGLVGIASFILDDKVYCGSVGIYYEGNKYRLTYPTKKYKNNSMILFHPINVQAGEAIYDAIINEYENILKQGV